jgi:hypothetical protein
MELSVINVSDNPSSGFRSVLIKILHRTLGQIKELGKLAGVVL